jgi:hypothetical protein
MNTLVRILTVIALGATATAMATPLTKKQVAADAKWVVHLDVDKLRSTAVGDYVIKQVLAAKLGDLTRQFDFDLDWNKVNSLTAYGTGLQSKHIFEGVVLLKTDLDLSKPLDSAVEKDSQGDDHKPRTLQKSQEGRATIYSFNHDLFVSIQPGYPVIVGKSLESIQKAADVLSGKSANLGSTETFSEFPKTQKAFFFLGAVEAFDPTEGETEKAHEGDGFNPKAKILKLADGGRVVLGEESNELFLDLSLKAKSKEVVTQMQQVIQGMIALASLSQSKNQELQQLAQSAQVSAKGKIVSLKLGYPADQAILLLSSNLNRHLEQKQRAQNSDDTEPKPKSKHKRTRPQPDQSDEQ